MIGDSNRPEDLTPERAGKSAELVAPTKAGHNGTDVRVYEQFDELTIRENTAEDANRTKQANNRQVGLFQLLPWPPASSSVHIPSARKLAKECTLRDRVGLDMAHLIPIK